MINELFVFLVHFEVQFVPKSEKTKAGMTRIILFNDYMDRTSHKLYLFCLHPKNLDESICSLKMSKIT